MASTSLDELHVKALLAELNSAVNGPNGLDESHRLTAIQTARELADALEVPRIAIDMHWRMPTTLFCNKVALDLGLFDALMQEPHLPKTAAELAIGCEADPLLIVRIMRVLTANGYAKEVGEATYSGNPKSKAMTTKSSVSGIKLLFDMNLLPGVVLPNFFKANGYKNPTGASQTAFQFAYNTKATYFEWMQQRPALAENFNTVMQGARSARVNWMDWFPIQAEVLNEAKDDPRAVTMVDVGGGKGHDLLAFRARFPNAPGRFILEDQQHVLDTINEVMGNTEGRSYDFFTPQPVIGARLYFMHYIFHNWDDESSLRILKNTASAMTKGYSKLYLNEWVLPDVGCPLFQAAIDIQMMMNFGGMERTQSQWKELLHRAGLKLVKFWQSPGFGEGIVEAEL